MATARSWAIFISLKIAADHERRKVFPDLRPGSEHHRGTYKRDGSSYYEISSALLDAVYDDARAQNRVTRSGPSGAGLTRAYCLLFKQIERRYELPWEAGFYLTPDPTFDRSQSTRVDHLFARLGIPPARNEGVTQ